jgi:hypothetical protein
MQYLGFFLLIVFAAGLVWALLQRSKGQAIVAAPFRKTAEAAANPMSADAKGTISVEGQIACQQPLRGPQSGQPCIYFHYKLEEEFTKNTLTEDGNKTTKEWKVISEQKQGTAFTLDDGTGPVWVQITDGVDADLQQSFSGMPGTGGGGSAGQMAMGLVAAAVSGGKLRATERIIPAQGKLFALGKLDQGRIVKTDGMLGKLILSPKGRDGLLGATKRNMIIGFVLAGLGFVSGVPLAIFGSPPETSDCPSKGFTDLQAKACKGHISDDDGETFSWTVTKEGDYTVEVTQPNVKYPIWPQLTLLASGSSKPIDVAKGIGKGENATLTEHLKAGTYSINVHDVVPGYAEPFKKGGGLSFWVDIAKSDSAPAVASAAPSATETTPAVPSGSAMAATLGTTSKPSSGTVKPQGPAAPSSKKPAPPAPPKKP